MEMVDIYTVKTPYFFTFLGQYPDVHLTLIQWKELYIFCAQKMDSSLWSKSGWTK